MSAEGPLGPVRAFVPVAAVVAAEPGVGLEWNAPQGTALPTGARQ